MATIWQSSGPRKVTSATAIHIQPPIRQHAGRTGGSACGVRFRAISNRSVFYVRNATSPKDIRADPISPHRKGGRAGKESSAHFTRPRRPPRRSAERASAVARRTRSHRRAARVANRETDRRPPAHPPPDPRAPRPSTRPCHDPGSPRRCRRALAEPLANRLQHAETRAAAHRHDRAGALDALERGTHRNPPAATEGSDYVGGYRDIRAAAARGLDFGLESPHTRSVITPPKTGVRYRQTNGEPEDPGRIGVRHGSHDSSGRRHNSARTTPSGCVNDCKPPENPRFPKLHRQGPETPVHCRI